MQYNLNNVVPSERSRSTDRNIFIRSVYLWLIGGFLVAAAGAFSAPFVMYFMMPLGSIFIWILFAIQFGSLVYARAVSKRKPINKYIYVLFTFICGVFTGVIALISSYQTSSFNSALIAFSMTSVMFLLLTCVAIFSKTDFSFLRSFVIIGIGTMFFGGLISIIFDLEAISLLVSVVAVIACSAKILWDTSTMLNTNDYSDPAGFALSLFVSVYNILMSLIRLLSVGARRD